MKNQFQEFKDQVVDEYRQGNISYRALGEKYGYTATTIHRWVKSYGGLTMASKDYLYWKNRTQTLKTIYQSAKETESEPPKAESEPAKNAPTVSELQEELRRSKLYSTLLEEIIALNEKEYGIEFRKKLGTKQSILSGKGKKSL